MDRAGESCCNAFRVRKEVTRVDDDGEKSLGSRDVLQLCQAKFGTGSILRSLAARQQLSSKKVRTAPT